MIGALEAGLLGIVQMGNLAVHAIELLVSGQFRLLCLKQFRAEAVNSDACYQQVIALNNRITRRGGFRLILDRYDVNFFNVASHPIARDLGLQGVTPSVLSFWVNYDFTIGGGPYP